MPVFIENTIMVKINPEELDEFIRKNRGAFNDDCSPDDNHFNRFLFKLRIRPKHFVSIVSHLIKLTIVIIMAFIFSIAIWNNFIRKDRYEITLKQKVVNVIMIVKRIVSSN